MQMAALSGLMGPMTIASTVMNVAAPIMQGVAEKRHLESQAEQARINSYIGETRAMQSDVVARQGMESELGMMRSSIAANNQGGNVGTLELLRELRDTRGRERRITFGAGMQKSRDFATEGRNASRKAKWAVPLGIMRAGPSLLDFYQLQKGPEHGTTP